MDDARITTPDQLDAALAAQHDRRIAKLRRIAGFRVRWFLVLPVFGVIINVYAYVVEHHASALINTAIMVLVGISSCMSARRERLQARAELEKELAGRR